VFFGETAKYTDNQISVIPDFVANCGMARVFAYLMKEDANLTDADIFDDVSETMRKALNDIKAANPGATQLSQSALKIALLKLSK
jgi:glutamate dehydrogenase/leucine dehydrogenase